MVFWWALVGGRGVAIYIDSFLAQVLGVATLMVSLSRFRQSGLMHHCIPGTSSTYIFTLLVLVLRLGCGCARGDMENTHGLGSSRLAAFDQ